MTCFQIVRGSVIQITALEPCGELTTRVVVSKCVARIQMTPMDPVVRNSRSDRDDKGRLRLHIPEKARTPRWSVDIDLIGVNADVLSVVSRLDEVEDSTGVVGVSATTVPRVRPFAMEVWSRLTGDCDIPNQRWGYTLVPHLTGGQLAPFSVSGQATMNLQIRGARTQWLNKWGFGRSPVDPIPGTLIDPNAPFVVAHTLYPPPTVV